MPRSKKTVSAEHPKRYEVRLDRQPDELLASMDDADYEAVWEVLEAMEEHPRRPLGKRIDRLPDGTYRVRQGDWRIIYNVFDRERVALVAEITRRNEGTYKKHQKRRRR